jgi:hopanoid biosynthesis associated protein HpnK
LSTRKQLVVNADDFGFTTDVNVGIIEAHRHGILTATTLMANGDAFDDAVRLARETPTLDIGGHLVLIQGRSLLTGRALPRTVTELLKALARRELRIYDELAAQVKHIEQAGIRPSHLDTHKHTHLAPPVLDAVARLAQEHGVPWVRRPFDFPLSASGGAVPLLKRMTSQALSATRRRFQRVLQAYGCRSTDHFAGFQITGRFRAAELVNLMGVIPGGSTELMCHPGRCRDALRHAATRLKESREQELAALVAPEVRAAMERNGIELVNYAGLARA